jgi:hypothetical protein
LRRSHETSTQIHGGNKRALEAMKRYNMGAKMEIRTLARPLVIYRLYHINYNTF